MTCRLPKHGRKSKAPTRKSLRRGAASATHTSGACGSYGRRVASRPRRREGVLGSIDARMYTMRDDS